MAALIVVTASPAAATFYPTPLRLALLFDRAPWHAGADTPLPVPPGLIVTRWER